MKYPLTLLITLLISLGTTAQTVDQRADSILALMTLEEKIGQMTQVERGEFENIQDIATYSIGSILSGGGSSPTPNTVSSWANMYNNFQSIALQSRLGIPLIYGVDAVHGHNNVRGAVIFPHNIGMGCTWNPGLIRTANQIVAREVAATGIDWTFAPCIAVPRDERWGRTYEGFGETAEVQKVMARESVLGLQGTDLGSGETILACAKHFVGDGGTTDGIDQGNTEATEAVLRDIHMEGYIDAIDAGVGTIMASFNSWNGVKLHGHDYLLTDVLKDELGFEGFIISDWKGVDQIDENYRAAIKRGINAGIDMVMVPDRYEVFISHLISLVQDGEVSEDRINDAVRRILKQKLLLNLFGAPFADPSLAASVGSPAHRDVARQAVRESMVLLNAKNDVLPLQKDGQTILVAGTLAADLGAQCGGWTITWQGATGNITPGTNILAGIENAVGNSEVIYSPTGNYNGPVDVAVVVVGEKTPYAEGAGDRTSLQLEETDINLMKRLKEAGIPTVAVLISGRPMILGEMLPYTDAMIAAWYPGTEGGGIAEVLFGDYQPSGQLTHSWPRDMAQIPINVGDDDYAPLFEYRHGWQEFPSEMAAEKLLPYAAATSRDGATILLALSDHITAMNAANSDFEIRIDGMASPGIINTISTAGFDGSILLFSLNTPIQPQEAVTLSYSGGNIASSDLTLDNLDDFYVYNTVSGGAIVHLIPGRVEAEDFFEMNGIQTEPCSDVGGGLNVGYIEGGDWMKYRVQITQSGVYEVTSRISGFAGGTLLLRFDDALQTEVNYTSTNGWQNWRDFTTSIWLEAGLYTMEARAQSDAFNINYFDFSLVSTSVQNLHSGIQAIKAFPNPMGDRLMLEFSNTHSRNATVKLIDPSGKQVQELYRGRLNNGRNAFTFPIDPSVPAGVYFIEIQDEARRYFEKVIKE
ncbi:MAG: glycoside hydrolase family 3 C-terminal domain-containing protein [Phaeodactylibacter sp.]|nr:glycoside hydrolase family 3 C-terminal domain-containing protein [Phaeodactylibacter sp.]